ncbi:MAG TPA: DNA repair protein RecN [Edaphocola sp.]|nr:DNA repair protein RecN [Edaphocola sp.]
MLQKLYIKNYAIIDEINIDFDKHLNVITGETGAGKSIILGALSLILGERADSTVLINTSEKSIVEVLFDTKGNQEFESLLKENDLDEQQPTIIRREIAPNGKSRAFINDTPVNLNTLNQLTACLVDLHRQFDNRALDDNKFMFESVNAIGNVLSGTKDYRKRFEHFKYLELKKNNLLSEQTQWQKEADYHQFLFDELEEANFKPDEIEQLEVQLKQLGNVELIQNTLSETIHILSESEPSIVQEIRKLNQQHLSISNYHPESEMLAQRLSVCYEELKDIAQESENLKNKIDINPLTLQEVQERYDLGNRLFKKHVVNSTEELLKIWESLADSLSKQQNLFQEIEILEKEIAVEKTNLEKTAFELSKARIKAIEELVPSINNLLHQIGMPNARFEIKLEEAQELNIFGKDQIQFLLDANKSGKLLPIQKAASGGELSRIMLSIKTLTAKALHLPTLIFDEVDTGISGEAAKQVGILLRSLGAYHQILCITHQPQVAGKGNRHFYVYKEEENKKISTKIKELNSNERIQLIATMIGGASPSEAALKNAKELVTNEQ